MISFMSLKRSTLTWAWEQKHNTAFPLFSLLPPFLLVSNFSPKTPSPPEPGFSLTSCPALPTAVLHVSRSVYSSSFYPRALLGLPPPPSGPNPASPGNSFLGKGLWHTKSQPKPPSFGFRETYASQVRKWSLNSDLIPTGSFISCAMQARWITLPNLRKVPLMIKPDHYTYQGP